MSTFIDNDITDAGRALLVELQLGAVFEPTRMVLGSGWLPEGTTSRTITDVIEPQVSLPITKCEEGENHTAIIGAIYTNQEISEEFYYRELGVYAKAKLPDGTELPEILYSYGNAGSTADLMAPYTSGSAITRVIDLTVYIGNDTEVHLTVGDGVYIPYREKGAANGVATLDGTAKLTESQIPDIDCGIWDESPVDIEVQEHNVTPETHESMIVDGNNLEVMDESTTLEEHISFPYAHQNLILDGNEN